jgi:alpha-N-arabinofuranosidase
MEVFEVNGPNIKSMNDFDKQEVSTREKESIKAKGDKVTYSFAPHSFTMLRCQLENKN